MASSEIYSEKYANVALKSETTEGTAESLTATEAKLLAGNISISTDLPWITRDVVAGTPGEFAGTTGGPRLTTLSMDIPLAGSGTAGTAPAWGPLMKALGFSETIVTSTSVTYVPDGFGTALTMGVYSLRSSSKAALFKAHGARILNANFSFNNGNTPILHVEVVGKYTTPTDETALAPTYYSTKPERVYASAFTLDSTALKFRDLSIDIENEGGPVDDPTDATNVFSVFGGYQRISGSINPAMENIGTYNFFTKAESNAEYALSLVLGATGGNIMTVTAPKIQYKEPKPEGRDGYLAVNMGLQLNRNTGSDALSIAMT